MHHPDIIKFWLFNFSQFLQNVFLEELKWKLSVLLTGFILQDGGEHFRVTVPESCVKLPQPAGHPAVKTQQRCRICEGCRRFLYWWRWRGGGGRGGDSCLHAGRCPTLSSAPVWSRLSLKSLLSPAGGGAAWSQRKHSRLIVGENSAAPKLNWVFLKTSFTKNNRNWENYPTTHWNIKDFRFTFRNNRMVSNRHQQNTSSE